MSHARSTYRIEGTVDPAFSAVRDAWEDLFSDSSPFQEIGSALGVYAGGRSVVDLWGGVADAETGRPWEADTIAHVWSTSKGILAVAIAQLADRDMLDYDAPVATYWPEFAAAGKASITVGQLLSHQSGINGFEAPTTVEDAENWHVAVDRLASQAPFWEPGTQTSYHSLTLGFLAGEVARRITGLMPADLIRRSLAGPLGADFLLGVPDADQGRIARFVPPPPPPGGMPQRPPLAVKAMVNPAIPPIHCLTPQWRAAQVPSINIHTNGRSLAHLWGAVANDGHAEGVSILSPGAIAAMRAPRSTRPDLFFGEGAWGAGVMINRGGLFGPHADAFGHCGFGGSYGFADPHAGIGVGYTPNRMFPSVLQDPRAMRIAAVVAECAGRAGA